MGHTYEKSKKIALKTIILLAVITVVEVVIALVGKGYVIEGFEVHLAIIGVLMIGLSLTKAYYIVYEFMHMKYEVPALVRTVLLPVGLLIWAVIAFFVEGNYWQKSRAQIEDNGKKSVQEEPVVEPDQNPQEGMLQIREIKKNDILKKVNL